MKIVHRSISELSQDEKVQIHFKFNYLRKGYAEIAREHGLDNGDIYQVVQEIERIRAFRSANLPVKNAMRREAIEIHRKRVYNLERAKRPMKKEKKPRPFKREHLNTSMVLAFQDAGII